MADFQLQIAQWYRQNKRSLPWRDTNSAFHIWLSEIILQQTKVDQGLSYYLKFTSRFSRIEDLANASEQEILNLWQGLGYYSRARNLHATAKYITQHLNGEFPNNYKELLHLKGVGQYTAAAIASFCFNEPVAVVDGNVYRVLSRYFDIDIPIDSAKGKKYFFELAQSLIPTKNPAEHNQAMMEFGALQCKPSSPNCEICPLVVSCLARKNNSIATRPIKEKKTKVSKRFFTYLIFTDSESILLEKRIENDIWKNMFQFPLIETQNALLEPKDCTYTITQISKPVKHVLSHQQIFAQFFHCSFPKDWEKNWIKIPVKDLQQYPLPRIIDRYLENSPY